jgi:hypothetical protein
MRRISPISTGSKLIEFGGLGRVCLPLVLLCSLLPDPGMAQTKSKTPPAPMTRIPGYDFVFGINLPWFDGQYGHDLGPDPTHPQWKVWYNPPRVTRYFEDIHKIGFRVVRIWLMERAQGWVVDQDGIITGLDAVFLQNLDDLVKRAGDENLKLYLCLTTTWLGVNYPSPVKDQRQQTAYLEKAVKPIARRFKGNNVVFAFDIFNEIESEVRDKKTAQVSLAEAQSFIRKNVQAIKAEDPRRLVSAGSGWGDWKNVKDGHYRNMGLDFYDIHVYRDDGFLPHVRDLNVDKPVIVGECGQSTNKEDDEVQKTCLSAFLQNAVEKGYAGCFPWDYGPKSKHLRILRENGDRKPIVAEIEKIIKKHSKQDAAAPTATSLKKKLAGTKWVNSNAVSFEFTADGRFLHRGKEREWEAIDGKQIHIIFGPNHVDTLIFNESLTAFKQLVKGGTESFDGKRAD